MSEAFEKARAAVLSLWRTAEENGTGDVADDEMLVVADALEEAQCFADAKWLRWNHKVLSGNPDWTSEGYPTGYLMFIGRTEDQVKRLSPPSCPHHPEEK